MKVEKIDADGAIKRKGTFGTSDEDLLGQIEGAQDDRFSDIYSLKFGWKEQPVEHEGDKPEKKLMSLLCNGKICFLDRSQNLEDVVPEDPYICLVYERPREAFAKILFPEYQPKIYIPPSRIPSLVYRDEKGKVHRKLPHGNSYEERIISAVKEAEKLGFDSVKIVFRRNIR